MVFACKKESKNYEKHDCRIGTFFPISGFSL